MRRISHGANAAGGLPPAALAEAAPRIVVGNAPNGDVATDVDFLDTGDFTQLAAAITAASTGDDVWIRPGTYDMTSGLTNGPIAVPAGVNIRGAGNRHVILIADDVVDPGCFSLGAGATLSDVQIQVPRPSFQNTTATDFVVSMAAQSTLNRVVFHFIDAALWDATDMLQTTLATVIKPTNAAFGVYINDCSTLYQNFTSVPSFFDINGTKYNYLIYKSQVGGEVYITGCDMHGADYGIQVDGSASLITNNSILSSIIGIHLDTTGAPSRVEHNKVFINPASGASTGNEVGIQMTSCNHASACNNSVDAAAAVLVGSTRSVRSSGCGTGIMSNNWMRNFTFGVVANSTTTNTVAIGNNGQNCTTSESNGNITNEFAHNL